jgi:hypothetical protein
MPDHGREANGVKLVRSQQQVLPLAAITKNN